MQNIEEIYIEYSKQVYRFLFCLTHNDALSEDLTQETFYIAFRHIEQYRGECKLYVWLCQIAKNLWFKELRKTKNISTVNLNEAQLISYENLENNCVDKLDLINKIKQLDEKTQEIFYLKITGELTFKEIREIHEISENQARVKFYRGKQKIKEDDDNEKK